MRKVPIKGFNVDKKVLRIRIKKIIFCCIIQIISFGVLACAQKYDSEKDFDTILFDEGRTICIEHYVGKKTVVKIPPRIKSLPVVHIGTEAFAHKNLIDVTIPDSVMIINYSAFASNQLTSITIPNGVFYIGALAFASNPLTSITIPESASIIQQLAFTSDQFIPITMNKRYSRGISLYDVSYYLPAGTYTINNGIWELKDSGDQDGSVTINWPVVKEYNKLIETDPSLKTLKDQYPKFNENTVELELLKNSIMYALHTLTSFDSLELFVPFSEEQAELEKQQRKNYFEQKSQEINRYKKILDGLEKMR